LLRAQAVSAAPAASFKPVFRPDETLRLCNALQNCRGYVLE
jgi:hypothetical protein